jgi:hypothetical protein
MRTECYLGLGLPLQHDHEDRYNEYYYPVRAHGNNRGSLSELIFVRELAMMHLTTNSLMNQIGMRRFDEKLYSLATSGQSVDEKEDD